jgi:Tfp pilus assembly protein PilN
VKHRTQFLDFAPAARQTPWLGLSALLVGLLVLALLASLAAQMAAANATQREALQALQARRQPQSRSAAASPRPASPTETARTRAVRELAQTLSTPWADLLESLEAAPTRSVALLAIEPSVARRSVRLTGEARTMPDLLAYLVALQSDARLSRVVLQSHEVQLQAPGTPVRFLIVAAWGAGP